MLAHLARNWHENGQVPFTRGLACETLVEAPSSPPPGLRRRWWAMRDRLDEGTRRQLVEDRQAGMTQKLLARKYAISLSSVQRLLRRFESCA
jgi:hypothetical protein